MSNVFISYSHADRDFAKRLASDLTSVGTAVWIDLLEIEHSDSIFQRINEGLELNDLLVVIMSPESISSYWVQKELDAAFAKEAEIIPILIKSCSIPLLLSAIKYVDFQKDYHSALFELMQKITASTSNGLGGRGFSSEQYIGLQNETETIPCTYCDGEGGDDDLDGHWIECEHCNGKGQIEEAEDD